MSDLVVVMLVDALGWEIARRFDFAQGILGRSRPLGTVLGYSSAAIPSLLSGKLPVEHGSWSMFRRAGAASPFSVTRLIPPLPHRVEWRARRLVRRLANRTARIDNYYDLYEVPVRLLHHFDLGLHGDPYQPGGLPSETVFDAFVQRGIPYRLWYYHSGESRNMSELVDEIAGDARVLFLYTAELDAMMHRLGIFHQQVEEKLRRYERFIERVVDRASAHNRRARVYLLSDHGMTDVRSDVDVWGGLARSGYTLGRDYLGFFDSTMVRLWSSEDVARAAAAILEEQGSGRRLSDEELAGYGCLFPDRRYGEHILLADPGVMVVPSFMGSSRIAAMHGYAPDDIYSLGCFYTNDESGEMPASILGFKDYLLERIAEAA